MTVTVLEESSDLRLPGSRRASEELPDLVALRAYGIPLDDPLEAQLAACVLSRFLGRGRAASRSQLYAMMMGLAACATVEVEHDGVRELPAHPEMSGLTWPHASSGFRRLGIDAETLAEYWRSARNRASDACFPVEWLTVFFPPVLWAAVVTLIGWGPEGTRVRLEQAAITMGKMTTKRETRRRPKGSPLAYGTVDAWISALLGLLDEIVQLRAQVMASRNPTLPVAPLEPWLTLPRRPNLRECGVKSSGQDNSGPPLAVVQARLKELARDYEQAGSYHRLKRLLLLSLAVLLGPRATALRTLDVVDFVPDAPGPDGVQRDALDLRPGKTWDREAVHRLPLPPEIAGWLRAWIRLTDRQVGQADTPLFPHKKPKPGLTLTYMSEVGFYAAIAGLPATSTHGGRYALVPLNGDPYTGYRPHALRHLTEQLAQRAASELKAEQRGLLDHYTPDDFARALLGHSLQRTISDVYRDLDRQKLSYLVVDKAWQILWGEGTNRKGIDPHALQAAREQVESIGVAISALNGEKQRLIQEHTRLAARARKLSGDRLLQASIESNATRATIEDHAHHLDTLHRKLLAAEHTYEQARTRQVLLPDDMTDEEHSRLLATALAQNDDHDETPHGPLADHLTAIDLSEIYGITEQAINRWAREGFPRGQCYWDPAGWIIDGPRSKRLAVAAIDVSLLTEPQKQRLLQLRRQRARALALALALAA